MRIGMVFYAYPSLHLALDSIRYVARSLMDAVSSEHKVVFLAPEYVYCSDEHAQRLSEQFIERCDVLVGVPSAPVLAARQRTGRNIRFIAFLLGIMPRGAWPLRDMLPYLTVDDVLVANSTAELEIALKFFGNAHVRLLPFAFDDRAFYPLDPRERDAIRQRLDLNGEDRIIIYAGRITLEKNIHTLLRVFSIVQNLVPNTHLFIVGPTAGTAFMEFGVLPLNLANTIQKAIEKLRIPPNRIHLMGHVGSHRIRELYSIADVKVNLTLHHDENFGLAQVEAMACGVPVIGTAWGGLKDTIIDGVSGYKVSTVPTPSGVKVNWWEAVNRIVRLLTDSAARERLRGSCVRHATQHYSRATYHAALLDLVEAGCTATERAGDVLQATAFAEEFWSACDPQVRDSAPYRRSRRCRELYQSMVDPFTERSVECAPNGQRLAEGDILCLAGPVMDGADGRIQIEDPIYSVDVDVPNEHRDACAGILAVMRQEPVLTLKRIRDVTLNHREDIVPTLSWMIGRGIVLRTQSGCWSVPPEKVGTVMAEPLFNVVHLSRAATDFVVY